MKKIKLFILSVFCLIIQGCHNNSPDYYTQRKDKIDLRSFFDGNVEGWGAIFDYQGRQIKNFHVTIKGNWDHNNGVLDEHFEFSDGEKTSRKWEIVFIDDQLFIGKAKDILNNAHGVQKGNIINIHYTLQVPYKKSTINLKMDDWMYKLADNMVLNRTTMKKFGLKVGELVLFMKKQS